MGFSIQLGSVFGGGPGAVGVFRLGGDGPGGNWSIGVWHRGGHSGSSDRLVASPRLA